ncbi:hypothetical protein WKK05_37620 (plasmid) [Nostoc sp. UHCC 0302]|uniref:hypothetical protein n=1 Tax=Nostoc sp. UHCC 0302 TaxID=3134896 RepID=UPI00311C98D6
MNSTGVELKVWSGYGLTINFIPTGEVIKDVWIGDPSRIGFTSNGNLCPKADSNNSSTECIQSVATVLFLRQIKSVSIPNMTNSSDGSTQITVITSGDGGQKQYQFKLTPATGKPAYTSLVIKPDSERPSPVITAKVQPVSTLVTPTKPSLIQTRVQSATPMIVKKPDVTTPIQTTISNQASNPQKTFTINNSIRRSDANAVAYGLAIASHQGQIKSGSTTWNKIQDAIRLLRLGKSRQEAILRSGIKKEIFNQLIKWGQ